MFLLSANSRSCCTHRHAICHCKTEWCQPAEISTKIKETMRKWWILWRQSRSSGLGFIAVVYLPAPSLSCDIRDLQLGHVGSSSPTRNWTWAPLHWRHRILATGPPVWVLRMNMLKTTKLLWRNILVFVFGFFCFLFKYIWFIVCNFFCFLMVFFFFCCS